MSALAGACPQTSGSPSAAF